jgi:hypothetical protein
MALQAPVQVRARQRWDQGLQQIQKVIQRQ